MPGRLGILRGERLPSPGSAFFIASPWRAAERPRRGWTPRSSTSSATGTRQYAVLDFAQLTDATISGYLRRLTPWAYSQMAPNGAQPAVAHEDSYWQGTTRLAASNAVLKLPDADAGLHAGQGAAALQRAGAQDAGDAHRQHPDRVLPARGRGRERGPPTAHSRGELGVTRLAQRYTCTGNWHNQLRQFHLRNESHRPAVESSESAAADESDRGPPLRPDGRLSCLTLSTS